MYILNVHYEEAGEIWENFENFIGDAPRPYDDTDDDTDDGTDKEYTERRNEWIDAALADYNAVDIRNSTLIEFETEEDATAFKLKFS